MEIRVEEYTKPEKQEMEIYCWPQTHSHFKAFACAVPSAWNICLHPHRLVNAWPSLCTQFRWYPLQEAFFDS